MIVKKGFEVVERKHYASTEKFYYEQVFIAHYPLTTRIYIRLAQDQGRTQVGPKGARSPVQKIFFLGCVWFV